ncbi:hypothetical protein GCM10020227_63910 [Streptomyces flavovirens]
MQAICQYHQMPVLNDEGGLLDNDGDIAPYILDLVEALGQYPDVVTALLTNRRPAPERFIARSMRPTAVVHLQPLGDSDINRLVGLMAKARQVALDPSTVKKITPTHRPTIHVEYPHPHERPNRHTGNAQPGHFNKIALRALCRCGDH